VVLPNKKAGNQVVMAVPATLDEFLRAAGDKLGMSAKKAFTENGALLDDVALIRNDEKVYISSGEPFRKSDSSHVRMYKVGMPPSSCLFALGAKSTASSHRTSHRGKRANRTRNPLDVLFSKFGLIA